MNNDDLPQMVTWGSIIAPILWSVARLLAIWCTALATTHKWVDIHLTDPKYWTGFLVTLAIVLWRHFRPTKAAIVNKTAASAQATPPPDYP